MNGPQITFFGNLVQDPESRFARNSGKPFTTMRVAVNTYRGKDREPETNYFNVTLWGTQAQNALARCRKGHQVYVEGLYSQSEYTRRDGTAATSYNVNAKDFMHMGAPRSASPDTDRDTQARPEQTPVQDEKPEVQSPGVQSPDIQATETQAPEAQNPDAKQEQPASPEAQVQNETPAGQTQNEEDVAEAFMEIDESDEDYVQLYN